jgi:hypothetical protein
VAIATVVVNGPLYWRTASQIAADVLQRMFCENGRCESTNAERFGRPSPAATVAHVESQRSGEVGP